MSGPHRCHALALYRQIFRLARTWIASTGSAIDTQMEKAYILDEARRFFRENKDETSEEKIKECIREGESRLGLAQHYGTPYPRLMNIPQNVLPFKGSPKFKRDRRVMQQATPIYLQSYKTDPHPHDTSEDKT